MTRRQVLGIVGASVGISAIGIGSYYQTRDCIRLGLIGCGSRGGALADIINKMSYYYRRYGKIVAVCDADINRANTVANKYTSNAFVTQDYRALFDRNDIEGLIIATPNHWHAIMAVQALNANKAVYLEKPMSHTVRESQDLANLCKTNKIPILIGTQQRSTWSCRTGAELVRNGRLGNVKKAVIYLSNKGPKGGPFASRPIPSGLDWKMWLGGASNVEFCPERFGGWHGWWDYGSGELLNWGPHHLDIAMWAMNLCETGPSKVTCTTPHFPDIPGGYEIPTDFTADLSFSNGTSIIITSEANRSANSSGINFIGDKSELWVDRVNLTGNSVAELTDRPFCETDNKMQNINAPRTFTTVRHISHFFDVVRNESQPVSDVRSTHGSNVALHLAAIALRTQKAIMWDPVHESLINCKFAEKYLGNPVSKNNDFTRPDLI